MWGKLKADVIQSAISREWGQQGATAGLGIRWESSHPSHKPTQGMGSKYSFNIEEREGLAGTKPANWLPSSQLRLRTGCQVPWEVRLMERSRTVAPGTMSGQENQPFEVGVQGQWEVGDPYGLWGLAHSQPQMQRPGQQMLFAVSPHTAC